MRGLRVFHTACTTILLVQACRLGYEQVGPEQGPGARPGGGEFLSGTGISGAAGEAASERDATFTGSGGTGSDPSNSAGVTPSSGGTPGSGGTTDGSETTSASDGGGATTSTRAGGGGAGSSGGGSGAGGSPSTVGTTGGSGGSGGAGSGGVGGAGLGPGSIVTFGDRSGTDYPGTITETFLQSESPDPIDNANTWTVAGAQWNASYIHGVMGIDVSALPPATDITGGLLHVTRYNQSGGFGNLAWHVLREDWAKFEAGWFERLSGVAWSGEGATGAAREEPAFHVFSPVTPGEDYLVPLPARLVQGWVDDPSSNHGIGCYGLDDAYGFNFYSSTAGSQNRRPMLEVSYNP